MRAPGPYRSAMWRPPHPTTDHPRGEIPTGCAGDDNVRIGPSHDQTGSQPTTEASQSDRTIDIHAGSASALLLAPPSICKLPGTGRQPRNRTVTDVVGPSDIPHRLAFVAPSDSLADLVESEFRLPSHFHAPRLGAFASFPGPGTDQLALKLCQA